MNAQEACIFIAVVVGGCIVHPVVPVRGHIVSSEGDRVAEGVSTARALSSLAPTD